MENAIGVTKARENFSDLVERVFYQGDVYIINRHGKPAAAIVPIEVYEAWKEQRRILFDTVRKIREANPDVDPEQVWQEVLQAQAAIRTSE